MTGKLFLAGPRQVVTNAKTHMMIHRIVRRSNASV